MNEMIQAVIFDMDGVLIDTEKLYNRFWCQAAAELGYDMKREHALMIRSLSPEFAIPLLEGVFGDGFPYHDIKNRRIQIMNKYVSENGVEMKKGADKLVQFLKDRKIKTAVATSSDMDRVRRYLGFVGLFDKFDKIICGPDVQHGKPMPDIYLAAAKALGVDTDKCIAVEDSKNGILSAYRAGCHTIMVPDLDEPDEETKRMLYARVSSLEKIIDIIIAK